MIAYILFIFLTFFSSFFIKRADDHITLEINDQSKKIIAPSMTAELSLDGSVKTTILLGTLSRENSVKIPTDKLANLSAVSKKRKIKVGFIDSSSKLYLTKKYSKVFDSQSKILSLREKIFDSLPISQNSIFHADQVIGTFIMTAEKYKMSDNFEYVYCSIGKVDDSIGHYRMKECLSWLKREKVDAINISIHQDFITKEEITLFKELSESPNVLISLAAGNQDRASESSVLLCKHLSNVLCIGSYDNLNIKNKANYSNYGKFVNVWENGNIVEDNDFFGNGTSFAAPRALAKFLMSKINEDLIIQDRVIKMTCPNNGCSKNNVL